MRLSWKIAVSGRIILTNKRLIFTPHKLFVIYGAKRWIYNLDDISNIQLAAPWIVPRNLKRVLVVVIMDSELGLFQTIKIDNTYGILCKAIGQQEVESSDNFLKVKLFSTPWHGRLVDPAIICVSLCLTFVAVHQSHLLLLFVQ